MELKRTFSLAKVKIINVKNALSLTFVLFSLSRYSSNRYTNAYCPVSDMSHVALGYSFQSKKNSKTELQSPNTFVEKCQA